MVPSSLIISTLKFCGALFWTLTYIFVIWRSHRDRAPAMPSPAVAGNVAIEATFGIWLRESAPSHFPAVYLIWLLLDLVIVAQTWRYGPGYYRDVFPNGGFRVTFSGMLAIAFALVWAITFEFNDWDGRYSAFAVNLMMSSLFVSRLLTRADLRGQSLVIGLAKLLGTLSFTLLFVVGWARSSLVLCLGAASLCLDVAYVLLLDSRLRQPRTSSWRELC